MGGPRNDRRGSRYASGVAPMMPSAVAIVAVDAVSRSAPRSSASFSRLATPRAPPMDTSPAIGPSRNTKKSDETTATTIVPTARNAGLGGLGVFAGLRSNCSMDLSGRARTSDDRVIQHVDVRGPKRGDRRGRRQKIEKPLRGGRMRGAGGNGHTI